MPSKHKSPFTTSFMSACNRGTSYNVAVCNIAKRYNKSPQFVWNSLWKAGVCNRQKFNGQWVYFPCEWNKKGTVSACNTSQFNMWQWYCEWCVMTGCCTPETMWNNCGTQKDFMNYCKKFFTKQFTGVKKTTRGRKSTTKTTSYKFPMRRAA